MSDRFHQVLEGAAQLAPTTPIDPDELWTRARRTNRVSRVVTAAVIVVLCLLGGLAVEQSAVDDGPQPADGSDDLGFPDDFFDIPSRTPTTAEKGLLGPVAWIDIAEHKGFWPWSSSEYMVYGVSAETGEYRFVSLPHLLDADSAESPDWPINAFLTYEWMALSPDGTKVAYASTAPGADPGHITGVSVYDTVDGQVTTFAPDGGDEYVTTSLAWSPDSSQLVVAMPRAVPEANADGEPGWALRDEGLILYDVEADTFTTIPGTAPTSGEGDALTWKPQGDRSPAGLASLSESELTISDPVTAEVLARFRIDARGLRLMYVLWSPDGNTLVASVDCDDCGSAGAVVDMDIEPGRTELALNTLTGSDEHFWPMGWVGNDSVVGPAGLRDDKRLVTEPSGPSLSLSSENVPSYVAADILARGPSAGHVHEPAQPVGWPLVLALVVMALYLARFVMGVRGQYVVRSVTSTGFDVLKAVWRYEGIAVLALIPALSIFAALLLRRVGAVDPVSVLIVMGLVWRTGRRSWGAYNVLVLWIIGYTAITAIWRLDGWRDIVAICLIGLAQIACLRSPAVQDQVGRGTQGPTAGFGAGYNSPQAITQWSYGGDAASG